MKKKKIAAVISVCLVLVIGLAGCGKPYNNFKFEDYIKVGEYKGLEVKSYTVDVTDEEVAQEINTRLEAAKTQKEIKEGKVEDGDTVVITYEGKVDGKTFEGGSAEGSSLTIGSGSFIDGFESGLIGVEVGKSKTLELKFPESYPMNEELAGKDVTFTVTVDAKQVDVVPTLDEEFIKASGSKAKDVEAYKKEVAKYLAEKEETEGKQLQKEYLWNQVISGTEVKKDKKGEEKYPEKEIKKVSEATDERYREMATESNMEFSDFLEASGLDEKTFKEQLKLYSQQQVKNQMVVYYIAQKEKIEITDKDYDKYLDNILSRAGFDKKTFKDAYGKDIEEYLGGKENIQYEVYLEKVQNFILKEAKVVDELTVDTTKKAE